jgi:uncharacterized circularly permuted ATP-grasp superfamily protein/uncharacterized alpha-E superfamily protein
MTISSSHELIGRYQQLGSLRLERAAYKIAQQLEQDGVTYNPTVTRVLPSPVATADPSDARRGIRPWALDVAPLTFTSAEWETVERGLQQRAELLDLLLRDLYGPRQLLREGLVPLAMIMADPAFHRPVHGVEVPGHRRLAIGAVDLYQDGDGNWRSYGHRTQMSAGVVYALENRRILARTFPNLFREAGVRRLAPFVRALRTTIQAAAPDEVENPSAVVLSPGPLSETAFEHAAIASRLGYPLVEGGDLRIRDGRVWLRTVSGLLPVHVILRQIPTGASDALELDPASTLGTPGLVEAARNGAVAIINPLGTGLAENFGLLSLLPQLSQRILGQDLLLPPAEAWWCGDDAGRSHVLANLGQVMLRPLSRIGPGSSIDTRRLDANQLASVRARIEHDPTSWVGQEPFEPGSVPVLVDGALRPQPTVLRGFVVADGSEYLVMPGGLARSIRSDAEPTNGLHDTDPDRAEGGIDPNRAEGEIHPDKAEGETEAEALGLGTELVAKDTWVLGREGQADTDLAPVRINGSTAPVERMPARAVENLFWLGRYAERAEATVRLLRVVNQRRTDFQDIEAGPGREALRALLEATTRVTTTWPGFVGEGGFERQADPGPELFALVTDRDRPGTVAHAIDRLMATIDVVRDQLSIDTWLVVGSVERQLSDLDPADPDESVGAVLDELLHRLLSLSGLATESMVRDQGWYFMDAGRRVERALRLIDLVADTLGQGRSPLTEGLLLESVATTHESIITYRRRYVWQARMVTLLELLFTDPGNPRSLRFQIDRLDDALAALPRTGHHGRQALSVTGVGRRVRDRVAALDPLALAQQDNDLYRPLLVETAALLRQDLSSLASALATDYFARQVPQRSVSTPIELPRREATA